MRFIIPVSVLLLAGAGLTGCEEKGQTDPQPTTPPDAPQLPIAGFRTVYGSLSTTSWPAAEDPIGNTYAGFTSPGTDQPMWLGATYDSPGVPGNSWMTVTRLDTAGGVLVTKILYEAITALQATADGGCTAVGTDQVVQLSSTGEVRWAKKISSSRFISRPVSISSLASLPGDGSTVLAGAVDMQPDVGMFVGKLDATGQVAWMKGYSNPVTRSNATDPGTIVNAVALANGKIMLLGRRGAEPQTFLMGLSATGDVEWSNGLTVPGYRLWNTRLIGLADGTAVLVGAQANNENETVLLQLSSEGNLLRGQAVHGLKLATEGVKFSTQGAVVLVGHNANNALNKTRPDGLFMGELNAQWAPEKVASLEQDPDGRWFAGFGTILNANGNYRYTLGNLIAPINGGVPTHFRLVKSKVSGTRTCSALSEQVILTVKPISPVLQPAGEPVTHAIVFQQQDYTPRLYPYNVRGNRNCQ